MHEILIALAVYLVPLLGGLLLLTREDWRALFARPGGPAPHGDTSGAGAKWGRREGGGQPRDGARPPLNPSRVSTGSEGRTTPAEPTLETA
jgi:hypothetical protein